MNFIYKMYTKQIICSKIITKINKHIQYLKKNESIIIISHDSLFIIEIKTFIIKKHIMIKKWTKNNKQYILIKYRI